MVITTMEEKGMKCKECNEFVMTCDWCRTPLSTDTKHACIQQLGGQRYVHYCLKCWEKVN